MMQMFYLTSKSITGVKKEFSVVLESVLTGHEGWIYGVHWHPAVRRGTSHGSQLLCSTFFARECGNIIFCLFWDIYVA